MAEGTWGTTGDYHPIRVRISWRAGTSVQQTGFCVRGALLTSVDAQEVADAVLPIVNTNLRPLLSTTDQIVGIDAVDVTTAIGASISPSSMFGTLAGATAGMPSYVAAVINLKGERRTRYGQGRMFIPVRWEQHVDTDVLNSGGVAAMQSLIDALTAEFIGNTLSGYNLCNIHGVIPPRAATASSPARPEVPPMWHDVTSLRLNSAVTFLRSRKAGVGS